MKTKNKAIYQDIPQKIDFKREWGKVKSTKQTKIDKNWSHFKDEPRVQEKQQVQVQQSNTAVSSRIYPTYPKIY